MKRIFILVAITLFLFSLASAFQGGGGESTKSKPAPKKTSGTKPNNTTPRIKPPAPSPRPETTSITSVTVNSNLPNVTVTINGRTAGITDSNGYLTMGSVKPGVYTISVAKLGFQPDKAVVELAAGQTETLNFALKPITQSLTIVSNQPECEIYVDDTLRGNTDAFGNAKLADVPVGEHQVTIRKARYREAVFPLSLSPDNEGRISANLELAIGFLTVATNTPNASIDISGVGRVAVPVNQFECQPGTYVVTISSPYYVTVRKEVSVISGREAKLAFDLEADTRARTQVITEAAEAYSHKQYDRAILLTQTVLSADSRQTPALTILAHSYFMKDDFNSFTELGAKAIEAGGSLEIPLRHKHGFGATIMHPARIVLTAQTISFDPQLAQDGWCSNKPFTVSLKMLGAAEVGGNHENEITLRLVFVDPNKPKKTTTLSFADRESYLVEEMKNAAGGFIRYKGQTMVSRQQAYGAVSAIAGLVNRAKALMKAENESSIAANKAPEVILENEGSDAVSGVAAPLPTVESIIEANIKAIGSPVKWNTVILKGTYTWTYTESGNTITGAFEEYMKGRSKLFHVFTNEKIGSFIEEGYDGGAGWYKVYGQRAKAMTSSALASMKRSVVLLLLNDVNEFKEIYPTAKFKGKGKLGELEVYLLEANTSDGRLETLYFDTRTGLLMRKDLTYPDPQKKGAMVTAQNLYGDYLDVGGLKIPTTWRQITPIVNISGKISDKLIDVPIDDTKFGMPKK